MRLPETPGSYILWLPSQSRASCPIGKLGTMVLEQGLYAYVGSALGPGGLAARLRHHLRIAKRPHWHIDHLRQKLAIGEIWYARSEERLEHHWARRLGDLAVASVPMKGFGSSDCDCPSHLFFMKAQTSPPSGRAILEDPEKKIEIQAIRRPGLEWSDLYG